MQIYNFLLKTVLSEWRNILLLCVWSAKSSCWLSHRRPSCLLLLTKCFRKFTTWTLAQSWEDKHHCEEKQAPWQCNRINNTVKCGMRLSWFIWCFMIWTEISVSCHVRMHTLFCTRWEVFITRVEMQMHLMRFSGQDVVFYLRSCCSACSLSSRYASLLHYSAQCFFFSIPLFSVLITCLKARALESLVFEMESFRLPRRLCGICSAFVLFLLCCFAIFFSKLQRWLQLRSTGK